MNQTITKKDKVVKRYIIKYYSFPHFTIRGLSHYDFNYILKACDTLTTDNYRVTRQHNEKHRGKIVTDDYAFDILTQNKEFVYDFTFGYKHSSLLNYLIYNNTRNFYCDVDYINPIFDKISGLNNTPLYYNIETIFSFDLIIDFTSNKEINKLKLNDYELYNMILKCSAFIDTINENDYNNGFVNDGRTLTMVYGCDLYF